MTETTARIAPWTPPEAAWEGLARDIVMWHDCYANKLTPRTLLKHLDLVGTEVPQWLRDEPEMQNLDHVISKGTRAVIIYRAMLQGCLPAIPPSLPAAPVAEGCVIAPAHATPAIRARMESRAVDFGIDFDKRGGDEAIDALYRAAVATLPPAPGAAQASDRRAEALTACVTCQGNGEIVTDWERYLNARRGDVGDEAVTECPDCDGRGEHATPPGGEGKEAPIRWCVHHRGPDDLHPVESYEAAVALADQMNEIAERFNFGKPRDDAGYVMSISYPAVYPGSAEDHAAARAAARTKEG